MYLVWTNTLKYKITFFLNLVNILLVFTLEMGQTTNILQNEDVRFLIF